MHLPHSIPIRPNLELKTKPKQLLGFLPLDIALPHPVFKKIMLVTLLCLLFWLGGMHVLLALAHVTSFLLS